MRQHWAHPLIAANKACIGQHGVEGPDALQVLIKVPIIASDLEASFRPGFCGLAAAQHVEDNEQRSGKGSGSQQHAGR